MVGRKGNSTQSSAPKGALETYLEKIHLTPEARELLPDSERELLANRDKILEQAASIASFMAEREVVARKIIALMTEGTIENFYNLPPVDGMTILELCALLNESIIEKARDMARQMRAEQARTGAIAKLANDPVQAAKPAAHKLWMDWQSGRTKHRSGAAFCRFVVEECPAITDPRTVERWCQEWRKNRHSAS